MDVQSQLHLSEIMTTDEISEGELEKDEGHAEGTLGQRLKLLCVFFLLEFH